MVGQRAAGLPARHYVPCKAAPLRRTRLGIAPDARGREGKALPSPELRVRPDLRVKGSLRLANRPLLLARTSLRGLRPQREPLTLIAISTKSTIRKGMPRQ